MNSGLKLATEALCSIAFVQDLISLAVLRFVFHVEQPTGTGHLMQIGSASFHRMAQLALYDWSHYPMKISKP
jgi:hypothetical protein